MLAVSGQASPEVSSHWSFIHVPSSSLSHDGSSQRQLVCLPQMSTEQLRADIEAILKEKSEEELSQLTSKQIQRLLGGSAAQMILACVEHWPVQPCTLPEQSSTSYHLTVNATQLTGEKYGFEVRPRKAEITSIAQSYALSRLDGADGQE